MIFIIRGAAEQVPEIDIKMIRRTPPIVPDSAGKVDFFCLGDPDAARNAGWNVVPVHDGWYADDANGGMAIWGHGLFWEVRDTPFTVSQACGPQAVMPQTSGTPEVDVRQAIFRG